MNSTLWKKLSRCLSLAALAMAVGAMSSCMKNEPATAPMEGQKSPTAQADSDRLEIREAKPGSALPDAEARIEGLLVPEAGKEAQLGEWMKERSGAIPGPAALEKTAATTCPVNFNSSASLSWMVDQCYSTFATWPYYIHGCGSYWVYSNPLNLDHFHLVPEATNHCYGTNPKWGQQSGTNCINQTDAKYWSRIATNMGSNTGVEFYVKNTSNESRNFTLKKLRVKSGTVRVLVYRTDIGGWWQWTNLGPGLWTWSVNNTALSKVRIYETNYNGTVTFDDLELSI